MPSISDISRLKSKSREEVGAEPASPKPAEEGGVSSSTDCKDMCRSGEWAMTSLTTDDWDIVVDINEVVVMGLEKKTSLLLVNIGNGACSVLEDGCEVGVWLGS